MEIHRFAPFGTIKDRVQIGASFGAGAGWYRGTIQVRQPEGSIETVAAKNLFSPGDVDFPVMPMARLELAVAAIITQNLKLRAGGGVSFPGQQTFSIAAVYLFAPR